MKNAPRIIDFHAHAFPDKIHEKAIAALCDHSGEYKNHTDGSLGGLLQSMDRAGIQSSVIPNIATKPAQATAIIDWSKKIAGPRIIPFGSVHPFSEQWETELKNIKSAGFKGIKLHSMYQEFAIDDPALNEFFSLIEELELVLLCHAGFDIAYPKDDKASPVRIANLVKNHPDLKLVAAHMGGWRAWPEVFDQLCGKTVYFDTSFVNEVDNNLLQKIFDKHDHGLFLFGTDSPWQDQKTAVNYLNEMNVTDSFKEMIFHINAQKLLELP